MTAATAKSLTVAATEPFESGKNSKTIKDVVIEQSRFSQKKKKMSHNRGRKTITIASTEHNAKLTKKPPQQQQDSDDSNPLACIDYACEAILSVFRFLGGEEEQQKLTDLAVSASPVEVPVKKQLIIVTDYKLSTEEEKVSEGNTDTAPMDATTKVPEDNAPANPAEEKLSGKDTKTRSKKQKRSPKKKSSTKKKVKALFRRFFKKSKKSTIEDKTKTKQTSQTETTELVQKKAEDTLAEPASKHESNEMVQEKAEDTLTETATQHEAAEEELMKTDNTSRESVSQPDLTKELQEKAEKTPIEPPSQSKSMPKKVSFAPLPEKTAPPSPTAVASKTLFDFFDLVSLGLDMHPQADNASIAAARLVPLPDSDSDSDVDTEIDSEAESVNETSKTFVQELNEMWEESDQNLMKVISEHISFDEDDDDEPLESDYVLTRYDDIVATEQELASFQPQPQMIAVA
eukprot:CAMPEP_0113604988 /NCGR_PEP_ID=MMETSP0017_2-20120614/2085_1 /TAXON_ID=2856 /ORGANISM="Cylindrotheca closterium" /LENGTH=459 /DNA_ID=CAMNT_0000513443 /DNA_START=141 /DNA_END=1520 /DNA_ORIENTATION=- /assembly_acc=CAM_ASM_000147